MSVRRKNILITPAKLRAQQANARLSRGPRTREGRRRSALNRRGMGLASILQATGRKRDARELLDLWRDLLAQFWFIKPELWQRPPRLRSCLGIDFRLEQVAWAWWRKLRSVRTGASKEDLAKSDAWIESDLAAFLSEFRVEHPKADYWLRKEFGADRRLGMAALRERIEARLGAFREQRRGARKREQLQSEGQDRAGAPPTASTIAEQHAPAQR